MTIPETLNALLKDWQKKHKRYQFIMNRTKSKRIKSKMDIKVEVAEVMVKITKDIIKQRELSGIDRV